MKDAWRNPSHRPQTSSNLSFFAVIYLCHPATIAALSLAAATFRHPFSGELLLRKSLYECPFIQICDPELLVCGTRDVHKEPKQVTFWSRPILHKRSRVASVILRLPYCHDRFVLFTVKYARGRRLLQCTEFPTRNRRDLWKLLIKSFWQVNIWSTYVLSKFQL